MRAATSVALIALLVVPALAAPVTSAPKAPVEEEPSITSQVISGAAGGAASGAVGNLLQKIESFFRRDLDARSAGDLTTIIQQAQGLGPEDKDTVKTALMNKISTLQNKRDNFELEARGKLGGSIASSVAGGAASGLVSNLLGEVESLFRRDDVELDTRGAGGVVGTILGLIENLFRRDGSGLQARAAGDLTTIIQQSQNLGPEDKATVKTALMNKLGSLQNKRDDSQLEARNVVSDILGLVEKLFRRDESSLQTRAAGDLTTIIQQSQNLGPEDKATVKTALMNKIGSLQSKRDDFELEARGKLGGSIASSAAGGAASGLVSNLLGEVESLFRRDDSNLEARNVVSSILGLIENLFRRDFHADDEGSLAKRGDFELEARGKLGGSIASSVAGGAASGLVSNLLGEVESLFRRSVTDVHDEEHYMKRDVSSISDIITQAQTLSDSDKTTVKNALMTKIGTLQGSPASKRLSAGEAAGKAAGGIVSAGTNHIVGGLLTDIENLFRRSETFEVDELD